MALEFQDYYQTLGIPRDASQEQIRKAYRRQARRYHPDVSKEQGAAEKFKKINEAYEVLKDPEKRRKYDALGQNWKQGEEFRPPPGWGSRFAGGGAEYFEFDPHQFAGFEGARRGGRAGTGVFSSFFEELFGGGGAFTGFEERGPQAAAIQETEINLPLSEVYSRSSPEVSLSHDGTQRRLRVTIPPGTKDGSTIRLAGQGSRAAGGLSGDLYLRVRISPDPFFMVHGYDLHSRLSLPAWDCVLGTEADLRLPDGKRLSLKIPPGTQSGKRLRVRGKGLVKQDGQRGDLYVEIRAAVPGEISDRERLLWEELKRSAAHPPRHEFSAPRGD